jgi:hypothetical protein
VRSIKNLLTRHRWHLVLLYRDEENTPRTMTLVKCRTKIGAQWQLKCFITALPEQTGRSFVIMKMT